ncbi:hypothetical protein BpHYR1_023311 [Brachionus plicatilis]|uniref:Uncharacterized protein n=1 Tax=Brachionus plicatilis TaxID=10195 RepID=A0A3M7PYD4_BRAPC|nr:hypothetical protein BpHYR1_023311 [Brachionus plicatilis]
MQMQIDKEKLKDEYENLIGKKFTKKNKIRKINHGNFKNYELEKAEECKNKSANPLLYCFFRDLRRIQNDRDIILSFECYFATIFDYNFSVSLKGRNKIFSFNIPLSFSFLKNKDGILMTKIG